MPHIITLRDEHLPPGTWAMKLPGDLRYIPEVIIPQSCARNFNLCIFAVGGCVTFYWPIFRKSVLLVNTAGVTKSTSFHIWTNFTPLPTIPIKVMFPIMMLLKFLSQNPFDHEVLSKKSRNHSVIQERLLLTEVLSKTLLTAVFSTFYSSNCYVENNLLQSFSWPWAI